MNISSGLDLEYIPLDDSNPLQTRGFYTTVFESDSINGRDQLEAFKPNSFVNYIHVHVWLYYEIFDEPVSIYLLSCASKSVYSF